MGKTTKVKVVMCPYCHEAAKLENSKKIYGHDYGNIWECVTCEAYVGCHNGGHGTTPLGTLANYELRTWRRRLHGVFDPMWKRAVRFRGITTVKARTIQYEWLSIKMKIPSDDCHIAMFNIRQCKEAIEYCRKEPISIVRSVWGA